MTAFVVFFAFILQICGEFRAASAETIKYEPLRCFECGGPLQPLCDGDDEKQFGTMDVNCGWNEAGEIDASDLRIIHNFLSSDKGLRQHVEPLYAKMDKTYQIEPYLFTHHHPEIYKKERQIFHKDEHGKPVNWIQLISLNSTNGKYLRVREGLRCWIMKVQYFAHGLTEIYKGCRSNMAVEYARFNHPPTRFTPIPIGYCKKFDQHQLVGLGPDAKRYHYADVTVCFCSTHNCNAKTLPDYDNDNNKIGMEDVEQRRLEMKRRQVSQKKSSKSGADSVTNKEPSLLEKLKLAVYGFTVRWIGYGHGLW